MRYTQGVSVLAILSCAQSLVAQTTSDGVSRFLDEARDGTRRYQLQANAIADGFRRVGVEFPEMGEHWVSARRVLEDTLVPARPSVLIYVNVGAEARLAGVGYTALLHPGEEPPDIGPGRGFWHEHNGTVADESFPLAHHLSDTAPSAGHGRELPLRLSVLHAWAWVPNADGPFVTENWSLPALRVGANAPVAMPRDAMRALALASDTTGYYALMIRTGIADAARPLVEAEDRAVMDVLADHRARAASEVTPLRGGAAPEVAGERLASIWYSLWLTLERSLPSRASHLRSLRPRL